MSGWFPTPAAGWPVTLERLQRLGEPLTESEAITDLRWHVDQQVPLPGRRELRVRWGGWSERAIRDLLADTSRWWDATKGAAPTSRAELEARVAVVKRRPRKVIPDASHSVPSGVPERSHSDTGEPTQLGWDDPTPIPDASHSVPSGVHARVPYSPSPSPSPSPHAEPTGGGAALEDAPTVEDTTACTMVVRGRVAPDPDAPTELQVAELVALQQTAMPSRADHDAVTRLLVKPGVTAEVARAMWEAAAADDWWQEATDTGEPRLRWRSLAKPGPGLDKRIGAAQEAVAELARRAWRNRAPDPAPEPRKTFDIFAKKRFETVEQHEQRVRNLRAMMAKKTADGAQK